MNETRINAIKTINFKPFMTLFTPLHNIIPVARKKKQQSREEANEKGDDKGIFIQKKVSFASLSAVLWITLREWQNKKTPQKVEEIFFFLSSVCQTTNSWDK
jgi:hypothetical protein